MTTEKLYEAVTLIDDDLIDEAGTYTPKKQKIIPWKRWVPLAACLVLVVGVGSLFRLGLFGGMSANSPGSDSEGSVFDSYAGPVFPLASTGDTTGITAERNVTLDFSPWKSSLYNMDIAVSDIYTLTNTTAEDQTVSVLYPFAISSIWDLEDCLPTLTAGGTETSAALHVGPCSGVGRDWFVSGSPDNWSDYRPGLENGSYLEYTLLGPEDFAGTSAIVYKFTETYGDLENENKPNPSARVTFELNYGKTTVLSYGFDSGSYRRDDGTMALGYSIRYADTCYVIVIGDDVENMDTAGYVTGGSDTTQKLDEFNVTVERYETDLDVILREIANGFWLRNNGTYDKSPSDLTALDFETYYSLYCDYLRLYAFPEDSNSFYGTDFGCDFENLDRICYLETEITIPAGDSVTLTAQMRKADSHDHTCSSRADEGVQGYDMVTQLGSTLSFTGQSATLLDHGLIEIVRQNFGFDLAADIKTVELDPAAEHYYLEVRRAGQ